MNDLRKKLIAVVTDFCVQHGATTTDFEFRLGTTRLGRISGSLTWNRYDTMNVAERQEELWTHLFSVLSAEELRYITRIYTRGVSEEVIDDTLAVNTAMLPWD